MAISPTMIRAASRATRATVFIRKVYQTSDGERNGGFASGFLHKNSQGVPFLVSNWHVFTSRYPDNPSMTTNQASASPIAIEVFFPAAGKPGVWLPPARMNLYKEGVPVWREYDREKGVDIAAIPSSIPDTVDTQYPQDIGGRFSGVLQPGLDAVVVGFPFEQSNENACAIWKSGMIASEPGYLMNGIPQFLIDAGGIPGMSGSPIYIVSAGLELPEAAAKSLNEPGIGASALDALMSATNANEDFRPGISVQFVGIYAGATGKDFIPGFRFGRAFMASFVDLVVDKGAPGENPFPPDLD